MGPTTGPNFFRLDPLALLSHRTHTERVGGRDPRQKANHPNMHALIAAFLTVAFAAGASFPDLTAPASPTAVDEDNS